MKIGFDATTLGNSQTGVGYYSEHLLRELLLLEPRGICLLSNQPPPEPWREAVPGRPERVRSWSSRGWWVQFQAPRQIRQLDLDIVHFTNSVMPCLDSDFSPAVVTVHDMSVALFPEFHPWRRRLVQSLVAASMQRARTILTVSESSRRDILKCGGISPSKVEAIHLAAAPQFRPQLDESRLTDVRGRYDLPDQFVLFVGTLEPRKNLERLVKAFLQLPERLRFRFPLVMAGAPGWGLRRLKRQLEKNVWGPLVRALGYVPFDDLPALHNLASAFVFPSLYEGFGLPVIEAMACRTPVITSDTASMREIYRDAAVMVDPESVEAIAHALKDLLESEAKRSEYGERGWHYSRRFSWRQTAERTYDAYRRTLG